MRLQNIPFIKGTILYIYNSRNSRLELCHAHVETLNALLQQSFLFWREMLVLWVCCCSADRDNKPRTTVEKYFWGPCGERQVNRAKTGTSFQKMC